MPKVEIYVKSTCGYCYRAKQLLERKGVDTVEHMSRLRRSPSREEMIQRANGTDDRPADLHRRRGTSAAATISIALDRQGKLDAIAGGLMMTRIALFQSHSGIDPAANARALVDAVGQAAEGGAAMLFTPEMSGLLDRDRRARRGEVVRLEEDDDGPRRRAAMPRKAHGIWVHLGSLAVRTEGGKVANRGVRHRPARAKSARATTRSICSTSTFRPARAGARSRGLSGAAAEP